MPELLASRSLRALCFDLCGFLRICLVACLASVASNCFGDTARLAGTIYTIDANQMPTVWPNARVTLKNVATSREVATVSNELGQYSFAGILPGGYELGVTLAGFEPVRRRITLHSESPNTVDIQLIVEEQSESFRFPRIRPVLIRLLVPVGRRY
jgi:hypothetical protein